MEVRQPTKEDIDDMQRWLVARGSEPYPRELLVGHGFCVPGMAACWIYLTGTPLALLEHLVANPDVSVADRDAAVDAVVGAALTFAYGQASYVYAMTSVPAVVSRSRRHGFMVADSGCTLIVACSRRPR
jgi:hypothetical protein